MHAIASFIIPLAVVRALIGLALWF